MKKEIKPIQVRNLWFTRSKNNWGFILETIDNKIKWIPQDLFVFVRNEKQVKEKLVKQFGYMMSIYNENHKNKLPSIKQYVNERLKILNSYKDFYGNSLIGIKLRETDYSQIQEYNQLLDFLEQYKIQQYGNFGVIKGLFFYPIEFQNNERNYWIIDIEVEFQNDGTNTPQKPLKEIQSIQIYSKKSNRYYILLNIGKDYNKIGGDEQIVRISNDLTNRLDDQPVYLLKFRSEKEMLEQFNSQLKKDKPSTPSMITGWFTNFYDIPYLQGRMEYYGLFKNFTTVTIDNIIGKSKITDLDNYFFYNVTDQQTYKFQINTPQVEFIDYKDLYEKYIFEKPQSWSLDFVQKMNGIEGKTEKRGYMWYGNDWLKFIEYSLRDIEILVKLESKLKLIDLLFSFQGIVPIPLKEIQGQTHTIQGYITLKTLPRKIVPEYKTYIDNPDVYIEGQYVFDPENETYKNVSVLDFKSLYPNIIRTFNISMESLILDNEIEKYKEMKIPYQDMNEIMNEQRNRYGHKVYYWIHKPSILNEIITEILDKRFYYKEKYKETGSQEDYNKQLNYKILQNSFYGQFGYKNFPLFNKFNQSQIPSVGRYMLKNVSKIINETKMEDEKLGNVSFKVVYGDSVSKNTMISIRMKEKDGTWVNKEIPISKLWEIVDNKPITQVSFGEKEYKFFNLDVLNVEIEQLSVNPYTLKLEYKPIRYIMRHKIDSKKKKMFRVYLDQFWYVEVTEDHSLITFNKTTGKIKETKPKEYNPETDDLIVLSGVIKETELRKQVTIEPFDYDDYVYDIEVLNNHNFFGNYILLHNTDSVFVNIRQEKKENLSEEEVVEISNKIIEKVNFLIKNEIVKKHFKNLSEEDYKNYKVSLELDLDKIFKVVRFFGTKKRYFGVDYNNEQIFKGIELVRSDTPEWQKDKLFELYMDQLLDNITKEKLLSIYQELKQQPLEQIFIPKQIGGDLEQYKVIPNHVRGLMFQKQIGIPIPDVITDKLLLYPVIIIKNGSNSQYVKWFEEQKNIFNDKKKTNNVIRQNISVVLDSLEDFKKVLEEHKEFIRIDYVTYFEKQILQKLQSFTEYNKLFDEVYLEIKSKEENQPIKQEVLKLFN